MVSAQYDIPVFLPESYEYLSYHQSGFILTTSHVHIRLLPGSRLRMYQIHYRENPVCRARQRVSPSDATSPDWSDLGHEQFSPVA